MKYTSFLISSAFTTSSAASIFGLVGSAGTVGKIEAATRRAIGVSMADKIRTAAPAGGTNPVRGPPGSRSGGTRRPLEAARAQELDRRLPQRREERRETVLLLQPLEVVQVRAAP